MKELKAHNMKWAKYKNNYIYIIIESRVVAGLYWYYIQKWKSKN